MSEKVNVNGVISDAAQAVVPVMDHGFLFGDSIYETLRTYGRKPFRWDAHLVRLHASADSLGLRIPLDDAALAERVDATLEAAGEEDASVRIVVTRGVGPMELHPGACDQPNLIIFVRPRPRYPEGAYENGLSLSLVSRPRNNRKSLDPAVKSGNYLNNILALVEARNAGSYEGLMLNAEGMVAEGTTSNLFMIANGEVTTPAITTGLLGGITRKTVIELCEAEGIACHQSEFGPEQLTTADEVFITSALKQIMPIGKIDGQPVGEGKAGPVTLRLLEAYRQRVERETGVRPERDS